LACFSQQLETFDLETLKVVGRGARFIRTASKHLCAGLFYRLGSLHQLISSLNRARSGHDDELFPSNFEISNADDCSLRLQLASDNFVRLEYGYDVLDAGH